MILDVQCMFNGIKRQTFKGYVFFITYTFPVYTKGKTGYNINREEEENTVQ